jgi:hypothetical protein
MTDPASDAALPGPAVAQFGRDAVVVEGATDEVTNC